MRGGLQRTHRPVVVVNLGHVTLAVGAKDRPVIGEFPIVDFNLELDGSGGQNVERGRFVVPQPFGRSEPVDEERQSTGVLVTST